MTDYPNETVQDAASKLMAALALHEDARGTVTDALHDMFDAGREHATRPDWWCAHHGEDGMNSDPEPWCHGCVDAGITSAPTTRSTPDTEQLTLIRDIATAAIANPTGRLAALHRIRATARTDAGSVTR